MGDVTNMLKNHRGSSDIIDKDEVEDHGVAVEAGAESTTHHRLGSARKPMSNIHGTNGYLVPLPSSSELLWVLLTSTGRNTQRIQLYALHGHHYTNAFFAIARQQQQQQQSNSSDGIGKDPFILKRISNEFLFRALLKLCQLERRTHQASNDGDIIKFASGLDVHGSDIDGKSWFYRMV